ncbi:MAG: hypothetical protein WC777_00030 [Candidatus Gracilibacteria bacterium]|jgi:hypothetical protein
MRIAAFLATALLLASCSLVSPYTITFTTPKDSVVDPATDTLDFVVSAPALAYISEVECDDADDIELLPVITDEMMPSTAHNLSLSMLNGAPGSECEITVTAFDRSTTATTRSDISVVIFGEPVAEEESTVEETPVVEGTVEVQLESETVVETAPAEEAPAEEAPAEEVPAEETPAE